MGTANCNKYGPTQIFLLRESEGMMLKDTEIPVGDDHKPVTHKSSLHINTAMTLILLSLVRALTLILIIIIKTAMGLLASVEVSLRSIESGLFAQSNPN
ncbi:MAG: hypothetical protein JXR41_05000 [Bacteroidales bacterium]|nr:hypothetical protein [Bacteroidales bacterium]MBN2762429.1 hypothetical protein [Bacteroidales bacterium]